MADPTTSIISFRLKKSELEELKILIRDTKAEGFTAIMRNFISCGLIHLQSNAMEKNKIFYQRFARYWDLTHHLTMYDDEMNPKNVKRQEKKMEKDKKEIQKKIQNGELNFRNLKK